MQSATTASASTVGWLDYIRLSVFGGAALAAGIACAGWLDGQQLDKLPGVLQARTLSVTAGRISRLSDVFVKPGESIDCGVPLLRLDDPRLAARIAHQRQELSALQAEVARAEAAAEVELGWRRRELQAEEFDTRMKLAALQNDRLNRQVEQIAWKEHLADDADWTGARAEPGLRPIALTSAPTSIERLQAVLKEDAAALATESLSAQIALCEQRLQDLTALQDRLQASLRLSAGVEVAERRVAAAEAQLSELLAQDAELTIVSPSVGVVGLLAKQPGDALAEGDVLLELLDDAQQIVAVNVPTTDLHQYAEGQQVTLVFPGRIQRAGVIGPLPPQTIDGGTTPVLPLQIAPSGKLWPSIPSGSRVDVLPPRS